MDILSGEFLIQYIEEGADRSRHFGVILPSASMPSTSARGLWARFHAPSYMKLFNNFTGKLLTRCANSGGVSIEYDNSDFACSNDLYQVASASVESGWIKDKNVCYNHVTQGPTVPHAAFSCLVDFWKTNNVHLF